MGSLSGVTRALEGCSVDMCYACCTGVDAVPAARERFLWLGRSAAGRGLLYLLLLALPGHACALSLAIQIAALQKRELNSIEFRVLRRL